MIRYKCMKKIDDIKKDAEALGFEIDFTEWDKGSDWFWIRDMKDRLVQITVNCFGKFIVFMPTSEGPVATERSQELDDEEWYKEILNLLYVPLDDENARKGGNA